MSRPIYREMAQAELERQYDARATVADIQPFLDRYAELSADARRDLPVLENVAYGEQPEEVMDVFPAGKQSPLFVFIHGGYWRLLSKADSAFMAKALLANHISVAAVNYTLAPHARLDEIVGQVRACLAHLWRRADRYEIDPTRIVVGGSSAGAHLAAMSLSAGWHDHYKVPTEIIAGALLVSGLYDLEPLLHCRPNEWLRLDATAARRNSPLYHLPDQGPPMVVAWAGSETSEFKRQSRDYAAAWAAKGHRCSAFEVSDRNHFDIILDLCDQDRELTRHLLALIETPTRK